MNASISPFEVGMIPSSVQNGRKRDSTLVTRNVCGERTEGLVAIATKENIFCKIYVEHILELG